MLTYADIVIYKTTEHHESEHQLQKALDLIVEKNSPIGLKVSELKTKCLYVHRNGNKPCFNLHINI